MAAIHDLLAQVQDEALRARLEKEINRLSKTKKFGLVFEEHLPECTPLYDIPVKRGSTVAKKTGAVSEMYEVSSIKDGVATCYHKVTEEKEEIPVEELVSVAQFGEPIYPYLKPIDSICNAPESDLWHTLIEADNYHALQLLEYLYAGKVDCIYIDPPYNTRAKDWKYNNDYVDSTDSYRHSKWLSFIQKRLKIAKKLLRTDDSVLLVTIDEKEYLHLGCLLEAMFPEANIQMISSTINGKGVARGAEFFRVNEYIFVVRVGDCGVNELALPDEWLGNIKTSTTKQVRWGSLMRSGSGAERNDSPGCFYPIYISKDKKHFRGAGDVVPVGVDRHSVSIPDDVIAIFPIHDDGTEGRWQYSRDKFLELQKNGYARISTQTKKDATIRYISEGWQKRVESGEIKVIGRAEDGSLIFDDGDYVQKYIPSNQWWITSHDATEFGSKLLQKIIGKRFSFPKSLYAVHDTVRFFVANKPDAIVVDFFAGSGTTLHAVNLLNAEDDGHRKCIMVTNNEVSDDEAKSLIEKGKKPGAPEWDCLGIARYVTWPRTVCSIEGHDVNGEPLQGEYLTTKSRTKEKPRSFTQIKFIDNISNMKLADKKQLVSILSKQKLPQTLINNDSKYIISEKTEHTVSVLLDDTAVEEWIDALNDLDHITEFYIITKNNALFKELKTQITEMLGNITIEEPVTIPMADGFKANAAFFKLGFLDKTAVSLGRQLLELLPVLWLKAGACGECPRLTDDKVSMAIFPKNKFAILINEKFFSEFNESVNKHPEIQTIYIVTDSETGYREMIAGFGDKNTYQLYRDYLDNFRINTGR